MILKWSTEKCADTIICRLVIWSFTPKSKIHWFAYAIFTIFSVNSNTLTSFELLLPRMWFSVRQTCFKAGRSLIKADREGRLFAVIWLFLMINWCNDFDNEERSASKPIRAGQLRPLPAPAPPRLHLQVRISGSDSAPELFYLASAPAPALTLSSALGSGSGSGSEFGSNNEMKKKLLFLFFIFLKFEGC